MVSTSTTRSTRRKRSGVAAMAVVIAAVSTAAITTGARAGVASAGAADWAASLPGFTAIRSGTAGGIVVGGSITADPAVAVPVSIYLPPGFSSRNRYPVVYLVRDGGSPSSLAGGLGFPNAADALIADGKVPPFVAVIASIAPSRLTEQTIVAGVVPWIDARLSTLPGPSGRAIVGVGAAGSGAAVIGLHRPDTFGTLEAWGGRFSSANSRHSSVSGASTPARGLSFLARAEAARLRRLGTRVYLSTGTRVEATVARATSGFADLLSGLGVRHELWVGPGRSTAVLWRTQLAPAFRFALTAPAADEPVIARTSLVAVHSPCEVPSRGPLAYGYPIKPFHRQHPIRGNFGDPRTLVDGDLGETTPATRGSFTFHNGVDISATTGQAVYPVVSGVAKVMSSDWVNVWTNDGRVFQYFHIKPSVRSGQAVIVDRTVLGHVLPRVMHVHLAEIDGFTVHNPVDPGHLQPYTDHTAPFLDSLSFTTASGSPADPRGLRGQVLIAATGSDTPPLPVPGSWLGFPVTPALVSWRLTTPTGRVVRPEQVVADFRRTEPANRDFWTVYAAGTYQNFPVFSHHYYFKQAGQYRFDLTPNTLDTRTLADGRYTLTVDAADVCGNTGSLSEAITIANHPLPRILRTGSFQPSVSPSSE